MRATWCAVALGVVCLATGPAAAQRPTALRVGADNDAFNFWLPPWERTDHEYTSGVRGSVDYDGPSPVLRRLLSSVGAACAPSECAQHSFTLGQAIFTGFAADTSGPAGATAGAGARSLAARPNAGWLYVQASERDSVASVATEYSIAIGIVGPPALGEAMQQFFHSFGREFQRPVDWSRQLPFEPGFVARYTRTSYARAWVDDGTWRAVPYTSLGGAVGTILTEAAAGAGVQASVRIPGSEKRWYVPFVDVTANGRARGVIRDEFLDGALFRASERVKRKPFVFERTFAVALTWQQLTLGYRVNHTGRQYTTQSQATNWSSLTAEWRLSR
ncbi:MAG: DUF2219 family protein [Gemmatimonadetes bacterium]|nr:DUF2219 family protein [Gemmatimonadota bacterium]